MEHVFLSDLIHLRFEYFFNRKLPVSIRKTSEKILLGYAFKVYNPAQIHLFTLRIPVLFCFLSYHPTYIVYFLSGETFVVKAIQESSQLIQDRGPSLSED